MGETLERAFQREESFLHKGNKEKFRTEVNQAVNQTKEPFWNVLTLQFGEQCQSLSWSVVYLRALSVRKQGFLKWISIKTLSMARETFNVKTLHSKSISVSKFCRVMTILETSRHISRCNYLRRAAIVNLKMITKYKLRKKEKT